MSDWPKPFSSLAVESAAEMERSEGLLGKGVIDDLPQRKILLTKGVNGLGFNIRGGIDAPYVKSDKGNRVDFRSYRDGNSISSLKLHPPQSKLQ